MSKPHKPADNRYPIDELLSDRWSPRAFADRPLEIEQVQSLLEAARWSASCFNGQPWRFVVALKQQTEAFDTMLTCLSESNRRWAHRAAVLVLTVVKLTFDADDSPNRHAHYDLGLAVQNMVVQATSMGLYVRQMAGILPDVARQTYHIPDGYDIMTAVAVGYLGDVEDLPERLQQRELEARARKPLSDLVFTGEWGNAADFVREEAGV